MVSIETFDLFSHSQSSQDLGMVDPKAEELELSIAGRDFTIKQSPGVLQSNRQAGTTGAVVWRSCVRFAEWLGSARNPLFKRGVLDSKSVVLELGSGISGLVPSILSPKVGRFIATDQQYIIRLLLENINANQRPKRTFDRRPIEATSNAGIIDVLTLDWETDDASGFLRSNSLEAGVDAVLACDCVFNYALICPFVNTCIDICKARRNSIRGTEMSGRSAVCFIAQQLRQPEVFEQWLKAFMAAFHVWRVPDMMLKESSNENDGFVIHIGILKESK